MESMGARTNRLKSAVHVVCGQLGPLDLEIMPSRLHSCNACELTGVLVSVCRELYSRFFDAFALEGEPNIPIDRQIMQSPEFYSLLERLRQHAELHQRDHWQVTLEKPPPLPPLLATTLNDMMVDVCCFMHQASLTVLSECSSVTAQTEGPHCKVHCDPLGPQLLLDCKGL